MVAREKRRFHPLGASLSKPVHVAATRCCCTLLLHVAVTRCVMLLGSKSAAFAARPFDLRASVNYRVLTTDTRDAGRDHTWVRVAGSPRAAMFTAWVRSRGFVAAGGRVRAACACSRPAVNGVTTGSEPGAPLPACTRARGEACPPWRRGARARGCPRRPHVCTWARTRAHVCGHLAEASVCLHVATSPCTCLRSLKRRRAGAASHRAHSPWEAHGILEWPWLVSLFRAL